MEAVNELKKIPPVTRTLCGATLAVTLPCMLKLLSPYLFLFSAPRILQKFQIWRLITPFFFGSQGLSLVFDLFMLYRDSVAIEGGHYGTTTASYAWAIGLINLSIIALSWPLGAVVFFRPMLLSIVYLNTRINPGGQVSLFGMITVPAQYFPWLLLVMDFAQGGAGYAMQSATGIISAHVIHTLMTTQPNLLNPPQVLKNWLNPNAGVAQGGIRLGGGVTGYAPAGRSNAGTSAGGQGVTGHRWGTGNRLG